MTAHALARCCALVALCIATIAGVGSADATPGADASAVPATTIRVGSLTVNGFTVKKLHCNLKSGGFLAAAKIVGALAKHRVALKACAKKPANPRVSWVFVPTKTTAVAVKGSTAAVRTCVAARMRKVRMGLSGRCSAIFTLK